MSLSHVSFYKFRKMENPTNFKSEVMAHVAHTWPSIKGTILVAHEGINACVSGREKEVEEFLHYMSQNLGFGFLDHKKTQSHKEPYRRFIVKVKAEIISMGISDIEPEHFTGEYVQSHQLKQWLDEGREVVMLDTRNDYEIRLGTFKNAIDPNIKTFRTFPEWVDKNLSDKKDKVVVTFCTGGIRCEKATAYMRKAGFDQVYQLHGGILRYLEETKSAQENYYEGDCFVFDYRVAVDKNLNRTQHEMCFACWATLNPNDLKSPHYISGKQCPHCVDSKRVGLQKRIEKGQAKAALQLKQRFEFAQKKKSQVIQSRTDVSHLEGQRLD